MSVDGPLLVEDGPGIPVVLADVAVGGVVGGVVGGLAAREVGEGTVGTWWVGRWRIVIGLCARGDEAFGGSVDPGEKVQMERRLLFDSL